MFSLLGQSVGDDVLRVHVRRPQADHHVQTEPDELEEFALLSHRLHLQSGCETKCKFTCSALTSSYDRLRLSSRIASTCKVKIKLGSYVAHYPLPTTIQGLPVTSLSPLR